MNESKYITIEGFENLSEQDIFDLAVAHIGETRTKSVDINDQCVYGGDGCNAAPLIRPEYRGKADTWSPGWGELEGSGWNILVSTGLVPDKCAEFILVLQGCHDNAPEGQDFVPHWKKSMEELAAKFNLNASKLAAIQD